MPPGPIITRGPKGRNAGLKYNYDNSTGGGDPGDGNIAFNDALALATQANVSNLDFDANDLGAFLAEQDDSTSDTKCYLHMRSDADPTKRALFKVVGAGTERPAFAVDAAVDLQLDDTVRVVVVQTDGKIILGGDFTTCLGVTRNRIARLNPDFTLDAAFDPNANDVVFTIAVQLDGQILVGGSFTNVGGQARNRIARLDALTGAADSFDPDANADVFVVVLQDDGKILAGGGFNGATSIGGQARNFIARLDAITGLVESFDPNADGQIRSIEIDADGNILAGGFFGTIGGQSRSGIARLDPILGLADSWNPNANGDAVQAIAIQPDGKVVIGGLFSVVGVETRTGIARIDPDTGLADSWNPGGAFDVRTVVIQNNGLILAGGSFSAIGGESRNNIARLDPVTGLADDFNPDSNAFVDSIAILLNDDIFIGGGFTTVAGNSLTGTALVTSLYHTFEVQNLTAPVVPFADDTIVELEFYRTGDKGASGFTPMYRGTSTSSFSIGTGTKAFAVSPVNLFFTWTVGLRARVVSRADINNWMEGVVTAHTTLQMTIDIDLVHGSGGPFLDWDINLTGEKGATTDDPTLLAFGALTISANSLTIGTGPDAFLQTTFGANTFPARASAGDLSAKAITDFGLSLVDDANAAAARTTLGLGTLATQSGTFSGTSSGTNTGDQTITLTGDVTAGPLTTGSFAATIAAGAVTFGKLATAAWDDDTTLAGDSSSKLPTQHAVKTYIDTLVTGLKFKQDCRLASTANVNVSSPASAVFDSVTAANGDRIFLKDQTAGADNGPYLFNGVGVAMTRTSDGNSAAELISATFPIREGTINADKWFTITNDTITLGTTVLVVSQTGGVGTYTNGSGLTLTGNSFSITTGGVTLGMMASVATSTLFYRKTAGTGAPEVNTLATLKTDLGLTGTNSGDQTITLTGEVTGSGTGSFATTIADGVAVTNWNLTTPTVTGLLTEILAPGANTIGNGASLQNQTAATSGNQQYSPALHWKGFGWDTDTSASESVEFRAFVQTVQGSPSTDAVGLFTLHSSLNGGVFTLPLTYSSLGDLTAANNITAGFGVYGALVQGNTVVSGAVKQAQGSLITLTNISRNKYYITGTNTNQTIKLPVAATPLEVGHEFFFRNLMTGTGAIVVQSSGANTVVTIAPGCAAIVTCTDPAGGTGTTSWSFTYFGIAITTAKKLTVTQSLTLSGTDGTVMTFPTTSATIARTDAANTFTGDQTFSAKIIAGAQIRLKGYAVATLPAGTQGDTAFVTDALAPTFLATVVGGGAVVTPVFYNGTNWVGY